MPMRRILKRIKYKTELGYYDIIKSLVYALPPNCILIPFPTSTDFIKNLSILFTYNNQDSKAIIAHIYWRMHTKIVAT